MKVFVDSEGKPWALFNRNSWEVSKQGVFERITDDQMRFLLSLGVEVGRKEYLSKYGEDHQ